VSDWAYVTIAYTIAWGGVALYALALARRVTQARRLERQLRETARGDATVPEGDRSVCDVPPVP
jgi:hypothetical protein